MTMIDTIREALSFLPDPATPEAIAMCALSDAIDDISLALYEYRRKHNLSQAELAKKLDISQAMVSRYEGGQENLSLETACNLLSKIGKRLALRIEDAHQYATQPPLYYPCEAEYAPLEAFAA